MKAERVRELLLLDGGEIEVRWGRGAPLRQRDAVIDRLHGPRAEHFARRKLGRHDRGRKLLEDGQTIPAEPEQEVRHEDRDKLCQGAAEVRRHLRDIRIALPAGIGGLDQGGPELCPEDILDLSCRRGDDRFLGV